MPRPLSLLPGPWPSLPLIGTGWQFIPPFGKFTLSKLHEAHMAKYKKYGPIFKEEFQRGCPSVHIFNPSDMELVFRRQGRYPMRPPNEFVCHYRRKNPDRYPNVGIAHLQGEEWYKHRQSLAPTMMQLSAMENHIPAQNKICDDFIQYFKKISSSDNHVVADVQDATYRLALESICQMCLDTRIGCFKTDDPSSDGAKLIAATKLLFEAYNELYYGLPLWKLWPTKSYRKLDEAESSIYSLASKYIENAMREIKETPNQASNNHNNPESLDLTSHLDSNGEDVSLAQPDSRNVFKGVSVLHTLLTTTSLSEKDVRLTVLDFIAGGIFTVSNSLAFLLYHMANNQRVQEKAYQEVSALQSSSSSNYIDSNIMSSIKYIKACVKESFRLTPTVPCIVRMLPAPIELSDCEVPAGIPIFSHFMVTSRLPKYFEDPDEFLPERWLGDSRRLVHPFAMLPFGTGNRMCAGRRFSEMELHMALAKVLTNFHLQLAHENQSTARDLRPEPLDLHHAFIVIPGKKIALKFIPRS